jgi:hypothetical protein
MSADDRTADALLSDFTSRDPTRIWSAAGAVRMLRDRDTLRALAAHVEAIRAATRGVDLGGALRPNATHLALALRILEHARDDGDCRCTLFPTDDLFDPRREAANGQVRILQEDDWTTEAECTECGARYRVEERQYHYAWWTWQRL